MPQPELLILMGGVVSSLSLVMWRIGRWQAKQEVYSKAHTEGIAGINTRLDVMNGTVRTQGERIAHLEGHSD